jgi:energy-converting hydrogenase A subunit M
MFIYSEKDLEKRKIINHINKSYTKKESLFKRILKAFNITVEDLILILASSTAFALLIVFLV